MNASTLIADYDLSVMPLGGFSGRDPALTASGFAELVDAGEARYVLATGSFGGGGFGGVPTIGGNPLGRFGGNNNRIGRNGGFGQNNVPGANGIPGASNGFGQNNVPGANNVPGGNSGGLGGGLPFQSQVPSTAAQAGSTAVLAAVRAACEPVTDTSLPAQYRGQLYDCAGHAAELAR